MGADFGQDVPCAAEKTVEDMFDDPQVAAEEMISTFNHSVVGSYRGFTQAIKFGRTPGPEPLRRRHLANTRRRFWSGNETVWLELPRDISRKEHFRGWLKSF